MFKRRFRLPSPALVISMVTLSLVLGGTAFAASTATHKDKKADTKLIKKLAPSLSVKHAATADSATNATHATSADSATNATHATSADSATNATHATSADSATNATNAGHATNSDQLGGVAAANYVTPSSVLQSGQTETGAYTASGFNGGYAISEVNFIPHVVATPTIDYRPTGTTDAHCPGQGQAAAGFFCVYETWIFSMTFNFNTDLSVGNRTYGWELEWLSTNNQGNTRGTWAYTAP